MQQILPKWAQKAQSISLVNEAKQIESEAAASDSEWHEQIENDTRFSSLFTDHDPSQCFDRSQQSKDWLKFLEEQDTSAHTLVGSDLPEDIQQTRNAINNFKQNENPLKRLSTNVLRHLVNAGDKQAQKILNIRELPRKLGIEIVFERGVQLANGHMKIETGYAGSEEATYYRKSARNAGAWKRYTCQPKTNSY
jgi:hypothetical protein